jgi:GT2 family glycosyltransferase
MLGNDQENAPDGRNALRKGFDYLKSRGLKEFGAHAVEKVRDARFDYNAWVRSQEPSPSLVGYQKNLWMKRSPVLCVIMTSPGAGNMDSAARSDREDGKTSPDRAATAASVKASTYGNYQFTETLNSQISDEDFLLVIREGDLITRDAFFEIVKALQDGADAVYTDEDSYREDRNDPEGELSRKAGGERKLVFSSPLFKPDYSPEYLRSMNYVGQLFAVRAGIVRSFYAGAEQDMAKDLFFPKEDTRSLKEKGRKRADWDLVPSAWSLADEPAYYDFVLRCCECAARRGGVRHVPKVLCHVKERGTSMISPARLRRVLEEDLKRNGIQAFIEGGPSVRSFHVRREPAASLVSIIIPSRDNVKMLKACVSSILRRSSWQHYEIIIVENNSVSEQTFAWYREICEKESRVRVIRFDRPFNFSLLVNEGVMNSSGEYVILMNNDVTVRTADWIERLLGSCQAEGVGAVGPKLLYPDGKVQSAGIVTGLMGFAGSMMVGEDGDDPGYMNRAAVLQNVSALTAACLMVKKSVYRRAGGFSPELAVALNDVDFCLRLLEMGYRNVFEPTALLTHHESMSRGMEDTPEKKKRFEAEKKYFVRRWRKFLKAGDPCYNPNLSDRKCDWSQKS